MDLRKWQYVRTQMFLLLMALQKCGTSLYDDFTELEPGALHTLEAELRSTNDTRTAKQHTRNLAESIRRANNFLKHVLWSMCGWTSDEDGALPLHTLQHHTDSLKSSQKDILHLLYCITNDESGTRLRQERLQHISTDYDLVLFLKEEYYKHRHVLSWLKLRHVSQIFVSRVCKCPCHPISYTAVASGQ